MSDVNRRDFLKLTVLTTGGIASACSSVVPTPMKRPRRGGPDHQIKTVCGACNAGCGISVRVVNGNATQIEGEATHPVNAGGLCPRGIAEIQNLYHPARLKGPQLRSARGAAGSFSPAAWPDALARLQQEARGKKIVLAVGALTAPERELAAKIAAATNAAVVQVEPPLGANPLEAMRAMLGSDSYRYDLAHADCVLALDCDWLQASPSPVESQRAHAEMRKGRRTRAWSLTASPRFSVTAAKSDEWVPIPPGSAARFGLSVAHALLTGEKPLLPRQAVLAKDVEDFRALALEERFSPKAMATELGIPAATILRVATELASHAKPVVITDRSQLATQQVGVALNLLLGAVGRTGGLLPAPSDALATVERLPSSKGAVVILLGANPAYVLPAASGWTEFLAGASFVASFTPFLDETAAAADLVLPTSTALEAPQLSWGTTMSGARFAAAGPAAVARLYDTVDPLEALFKLAHALGTDLPWANAQAYVAEKARSLGLPAVPKAGGVLALSAPSGTLPQATLFQFAAKEIRAAVEPAKEAGHYPLGLDVYAPMAFLGGLGAHLPILHGLSGTDGRQFWQTYVLIHPETARRAGIGASDAVWVESARGKIGGQARLTQTLRPDAVAIALGLGRKALGPFAEGHGESPLALLAEDPHEPGGVAWRTCRVQLRRAS